MAPLFKAHLYDANRNWLYPVGSFVKVEGTLRYNQISDCEITVKATHKRLSTFLNPGTRLRLDLRGQTILQGPIRSHEGEGPGTSTTYTFGAEDNFRILRNLLVYPVPGAALNAQTTVPNYTVSGDMETVFKDVVSKNAGRHIEPITVATNLHRGGFVTSSARMATVYNELFPLLEERGLGATVTSTPAGLVVDVFTPGTFDNKLSVSSRTIRKWKYKLEAPDVTDVVVGGGGEGTARIFIKRNDSARRTLWGDHIEVFRDARDTSTTATLNDRGDETLFDGRGSVSIECTLAETDNFHFGGATGLQIGQMVTAEIDGGVTVTDILREVDFSWDADNGLKLKAQIGQPQAPVAKLMRSISKLAMSVDKMKGAF